MEVVAVEAAVEDIKVIIKVVEAPGTIKEVATIKEAILIIKITEVVEAEVVVFPVITKSSTLQCLRIIIKVVVMAEAEEANIKINSKITLIKTQISNKAVNMEHLDKVILQAKVMVKPIQAVQLLVKLTPQVRHLDKLKLKILEVLTAKIKAPTIPVAEEEGTVVEEDREVEEVMIEEAITNRHIVKLLISKIIINPRISTVIIISSNI